MSTLVIAALFGLGVVCIYDAAVRPMNPKDLRARLGHRMPGMVCGAVIGMGAYAISSWPVIGCAGVVLGVMTPGMIAGSRNRRLSLARREAIAEIAGRLRDSVRAGIGLADALVAAAAAAPPSLSRELSQLVSTARISGMSAAALEFAAAVPDPSAAMLAAALRFTDSLGARSLSDVLDSLAESTAAEASTVREAQARQASARTSARVISAIPGLLLVAIRHENPAYVAPLAEKTGQAVLALAALMIGAGYMVMRRLGHIEAGGA